MSANNSYVVALDNLSSIPGWLSDLLCSISTGAAYRERKYHTNNGEEELFKAKRPLVLNGIDFAMRDDLLSRLFLVGLPVIPDEDRQNESELWTAINAATPSILGGIFDCLSSILNRLPSTDLDSKPRMADAARWITAAEKSLSWAPGTFLQIYGGNRNKSVELALESDSFGLALRQFMDDQCGAQWTGGWQEMVDLLSKGQNNIGSQTVRPLRPNLSDSHLHSVTLESTGPMSGVGINESTRYGWKRHKRQMCHCRSGMGIRRTSLK